MKKETSPLQKMLNIWAIVLILWAFYRTKFSLPEPIDEFIVKPAVFILPVYYFIKHVEKSDFLSGIWLKTNNFIADSKFGLSIGAFFWLMIVTTNYIRVGNFSFLFKKILIFH